MKQSVEGPPEPEVTDKALNFLADMWNGAVEGIDKGLDFTKEKSKQASEKWDASETG